MIRRTPLRKVSKKRAIQMREYLARRKEYLSVHLYCELCGDARATDIHHVRGRIGLMLLDETHWCPVCRPCHVKIHTNGSWARENGWLK